MKRIKNWLMMIAILCFGFVLGACGLNVVSAEQNNPIKIWAQNRNGQYNTAYIVDDITGVNYIVVSTSYSEYGSEMTSVAIAERKNADNSLYVTPKE